MPRGKPRGGGSEETGKNRLDEAAAVRLFKHPLPQSQRTALLLSSAATVSLPKVVFS